MPSPLPSLIPRSSKSGVIAAVVGVGLLLTASVGISYHRNKTTVGSINYTQLHALGVASAASSLSVAGDFITVVAKDGTTSQALVTNQAAQQEIVETFRKGNVPVEFHTARGAAVATALNWLIPVLAFIAFGVIGWRVYASMNGGGKRISSTGREGKAGRLLRGCCRSE